MLLITLFKGEIPCCFEGFQEKTPGMCLTTAVAMMLTRYLLMPGQLSSCTMRFQINEIKNVGSNI